MTNIKVAILTVSDRSAAGTSEDRSGPLLRQILQNHAPAWEVAQQAIVPDEYDIIRQTLRQWCDDGIHLILTTGGTGFAPRDVTPEATKSVIERETPGITEALRAESMKITQHAMLSRAVAGIRGQTLIINLPGNPKAVRENMTLLLPVLPHALALLNELPDTEQQHRTV